MKQAGVLHLYSPYKMKLSSNPLQNAQFICSSPNLATCPADIGYEVAFAGRSNAGKSSAINCITQQKKLARTSKTPGRTQQINFFEFAERRRLVDLPGYGYAKVPEAMKLAWQENMQEYLEHRKSLKGIILLMDSRHPLKDFDILMMDWARQYDMPLHVLLTKADKLKQNAKKQTLMQLSKHIESGEYGQTSVQLFSSLKSTGVQEVNKILLGWLES